MRILLIHGGIGKNIAATAVVRSMHNQAAAVAKRLTLAALDGVAEGARDYAAGLSPPSGHGTPAVPG